jgi:hypothetical protein
MCKELLVILVNRVVDKRRNKMEGRGGGKAQEKKLHVKILQIIDTYIHHGGI